MPKPGMPREVVHELEHELEDAIARVLEEYGDEIPLGPDRRLVQFMAKAATAAYEAAASQTED